SWCGRNTRRRRQLVHAYYEAHPVTRDLAGRERGHREVAPFLFLFEGGLFYPFGGGGTFCGTARGSPSAGAKKFGAPAPLGSVCGGDGPIGVAVGAMDEGAME